MATTSDTTEITIGESDEYKDEATLRHLYWSQEMTMCEIGERYDVCPGTIQYWMNKHDIDRRDPGNEEIYKELPEYFVRYTANFEQASDIVGQNVHEMGVEESVKAFQSHDDELLLRLTNRSNDDAYYIGPSQNSPGYSLFRSTTIPTSVELDSTYVQSLLDQYDVTLMHRDGVSMVQ